MGTGNSAKSIFGIKENEDLKVTFGFGDLEVITDLKSNFSEQQLNVND